ncbi:MAG: ribosome biogenesis/translation initiation ATPase RLI [Candidatus Altiarchaeota archaeon]|nr:ribosome biogenesis/translation initiation ATPase RLI [Candidatus Altiarchaeota archaeon]
MRIAVLNKDRCKPKECNFLCVRICPRVKTGDETIVVDEETNKPVIAEDLCSGCGICVKKCPFGAITIINLPEEVGRPVHQYGVNGFRLYNLPTPREGVVGIVGANGIGKTTVMKILSGELKPNLGAEAGWEEIIERFRGKEVQSYVEKLRNKEVRAVYKPQYVDSIPKHVGGVVRGVLEKGDELGNLEEIIETLNLRNALGKEVNELSGGELQRFAIAACLTKDASIYLLDEPSSYLDVRERLNVAKAVRGIKDRYVFVVEHDLIVLDYLSDYVHVIYGKPGAYGIISNIKSVRVGINEYLDGFLRSENTRFRDEIRFEVRPPSEKKELNEILSYPDLVKEYDGFRLSINSGVLYAPEILGILGPNATGKTTFVRMLAGDIEADNLDVGLKAKISYKPQYIRPQPVTVNSLKLKPELVQRFNLTHMIDRKVDELSGGELQKVAIVDCLSREADLYLLDEPSAYLDVEERLALGKYLKKFAIDNEVSVLIVEHDILLIDYLSDELMVFEGVSGVNGKASEPLSPRAGMNQFLKKMNVTFRRDPETGRPRANKEGSVKDREQKKSGEYYYIG